MHHRSASRPRTRWKAPSPRADHHHRSHRSVKLASTYRQPGAAAYRSPGGAWDVPVLDVLLSSPRDPTGLAVVDGETSLTAADLESLVGAVAGAMRRRGVRRGSIVTWQLPNWWEAIVLFRACWRIGAVAAPIHHQVGAAEVERVLADLQPALVFTTPGLPLDDLRESIVVRVRIPISTSCSVHRRSRRRCRWGSRIGHRCGAVHLRLDR